MTGRLVTMVIGEKSLTKSNVVLWRARDELGRDARSGSRLVLHHELLADDLAHAVGEHARGDVGRGARPESDDDAHRSRRKIFRLRGRRRGEKRECNECGAPQAACHGIPLGYFFNPAARETWSQRFISLSM